MDIILRKELVGWKQGDGRWRLFFHIDFMEIYLLGL